MPDELPERRMDSRNLRMDQLTAGWTRGRHGWTATAVRKKKEGGELSPAAPESLTSNL
jgi:hypothetical protein